MSEREAVGRLTRTMVSSAAPSGTSHERPPVIIVRNATLVLATWEAVVIARWLAPPGANEMRDMRVALRPFALRVGHFAAFNVVEAQRATQLAEDARLEVIATQREFGARQRCLATMIEGVGFYAATVRSVAAGLALISRAPFPQRVFSDVTTAAAWVAQETPEIGKTRGPALAAAVDATR